MAVKFSPNKLSSVAEQIAWSRESRFFGSATNVHRFRLIPSEIDPNPEYHLQEILRQFSVWHKVPLSAPKAMEPPRVILQRIQGKIKAAFQVMHQAHEGQTRQASGEPYWTHPVHTAIWAAQTAMSWEAVCASLLHDTVEDGKVKLSDIQRQFGDNVAYLVYRLSNFRFRNGKVVNAWSDSYHAEPTEKDILLEKKHKLKLAARKRMTFLRGSNYSAHWEPVEVQNVLKRFKRQGYSPEFLNPLDIQAMMIKGLDIVHNENTQSGLPEEKRRRYVEKQQALALVHFLEAFSPAYLESIPSERAAQYRQRANTEGPFGFYTRLAGRKKLNLQRLYRLPPAHAPTINVHDNEDGSYDVLFPYAGFGGDKAVNDQLFLELVKQIHRRLNPEGEVIHDESFLPQGFPRFHAFRVRLGNLAFADLENALRHTYLKYSTTAFETDAHQADAAGLFAAYEDPQKKRVGIFIPRSDFTFGIHPDTHEHSDESLDQLPHAIHSFYRQRHPELAEGIHVDAPVSHPFNPTISLTVKSPLDTVEGLEHHLKQLGHYLRNLKLPDAAPVPPTDEELDSVDPKMRPSKKYRRYRFQRKGPKGKSAPHDPFQRPRDKD